CGSLPPSEKTMIPLLALLLPLWWAGTGTSATARQKPQPKPAPPPVLEGAVKGPQGKPVEGALVLVQCPTAMRSEPPLSTRTDASGRFQIPLRRPDACKLRVEARGFAPALRDKARPGTSLLFVLEKGGAIEGVVRDAAGGQPLAGARVVASTGQGLS